MKIISKRQAMTIYRQHPQSRLFRFCTGKYTWSGSICHYAGRGGIGHQRCAGRLCGATSGPQRPLCRIAQCYSGLNTQLRIT